jgi:hypothetical protein
VCARETRLSFIKIKLGQGVISFVVALSVKVRPNKFLGIYESVSEA